MATVTFTPAQSWFQPSTSHEGVNVVVGELTVTTSSTTWGKVLLAKVPHGATIISLEYLPGAAASGNYEVGFSATHSVLVSTATMAAASVQRLNVSLGYRVSVSDNAPNRWDYMVASQSLSFSGVYRFVLTYSMAASDQQGSGPP